MSWNKSTDIFALMTGHGKSMDGSWDSGCVYGSYTEAGLMQKITVEAVKHLRASGVKVLTDSDNSNNRNMISCVSWANANGAKYYISVHCDYSLASAGVYPQYVSSAGKTMSTKIGKSVASQLGMKWKGAAKRTDLYELNATNMVSVVFETGAIKADLAKLKDYKTYGKALAKAICSFIGVTFKAYSTSTSTSTKTTSTTSKLTYPDLPKRGYFQKGDNGVNVKRLQTCLNKYGFSCGTVDGMFGTKTESAVKAFQKKYKLTVDGLFGAKSLAKLKSLK